MNGDIKPIEIMARREDWSNGISLRGRQVIEGVSQSVITKPKLEPYAQGNYIEPFMELSIQSAQNLMDELWQCGLRPTEGAGSAGSLAATERHLHDMQEIAFKKLGIDR